MNKFILDFNLIKENSLSTIEFIYLLEIYNNDFTSGLKFNSNEIYENLQNNGYIKIIEDINKYQYVLREKGKQFIESCIYKTFDEKLVTHYEVIDNHNKKWAFEEFVKEYRNLWKGLKVGSQGNPKSVEDKLKRWMKENPDYNQDDILRAARTYINSLDDFKYLQKADYFIYKRDKFGEQSRLSDFIDEDEIIEEGWGSELK